MCPGNHYSIIVIILAGAYKCHEAPQRSVNLMVITIVKFLHAGISKFELLHTAVTLVEQLEHMANARFTLLCGTLWCFYKLLVLVIHK